MPPRALAMALATALGVTFLVPAAPADAASAAPTSPATVSTMAVAAWREMLPRDVEALLAFKRAASGFPQMLEEWDPDAAHPCDWRYVYCRCEGVINIPAVECPDASNDTSPYERVRALQFLIPQRPSPSWNLQGTIASEIGELDQMRALLLSYNQLTGTIPTELGRLEKLDLLMLHYNRLTGTVPAELFSAHGAVVMELSNNRLEGRLPELSVCGDNITVRNEVFRASQNERLCGEFPECLSSFPLLVIPDNFADTCLVLGPGEGGGCDASPPTCVQADGACVSAPTVINSLTTFQFQVRGLRDEHSGVRALKWFVGTSPGLEDALRPTTLPLDLAPGNWSSPDADLEMRLDSVALRNGHTYFVSVQAINGACPEQSAVFSSGGVLVDNTPPVPRSSAGAPAVFANRDCDGSALTHHNRSHVTACWLPFVEEESAISYYNITLFSSPKGEDASAVATGLETPLQCPPLAPRCTFAFPVAVPAASLVSVAVTACNTAGGCALARSQTVVASGQKQRDELVAVLQASVTAAVVLLVVLFVVFYRYMRHHNKLAKRQRIIHKDVQYMERLLRHTLLEQVPALGSGAEPAALGPSASRLTSAHLAARARHSTGGDHSPPHLGSWDTAPRDPIGKAKRLSLNLDISPSSGHALPSPQAASLPGSRLKAASSAGWEGRRDAREAGEAAPQGGAELGGLQQSSDSFDLAHGSHRLGSESAFTDSDSVLNSKQLAFVFTDIQDSTPISALAPASYKRMQDIHDMVMRVQIAMHGGYEVNTQGDSFEIALPTVQDAVLFCLQVQEELLGIEEQEWGFESGEARLPATSQELDALERPVFRGLRVRMGIHAAEAGTFDKKLNQVTKHFQFSGPAFKLGSELGDCAHGGQILLTKAAFDLATHLAEQGSAVFRDLGVFELPSHEQVHVYEALPPLASYRAIRSFPVALRNCKHVTPGGLFACMPHAAAAAPNPASSGLEAPRKLCMCFIKPPPTLPDHLVDQAESLLSMLSQSYSGYLTMLSHNRMCYVFVSPINAVNFALAAQVVLMTAAWPGPDGEVTQRTTDFKPLVRGPQFAMLIHHASDVHISPGPKDSPDAEPSEVGAEAAHPVATPPVQRLKGRSWRRKGAHLVASRRTRTNVFQGPGLDYVARMIHMAFPGQVVCTEEVWIFVQHIVTRSYKYQVLSLGRHMVFGVDQPQTLFELAVNGIESRLFPAVPSLKCLDKGYRQSPDPARPVVSVFAKVQECPETAPAGVSHGALDALYAEAVLQWCALLRACVFEFDGYECKEPSSGKFTLAFDNLQNAVVFASTVQARLLEVPWSDELLALEPFQRVYERSTGTLVWAGLRVSIGLSRGMAASRKPLKTGRADYFGQLPNTAARLMAACAPGQVLVDGSGVDDILQLVVPPIPCISTRSETAKTHSALQSIVVTLSTAASSSNTQRTARTSESSASMEESSGTGVGRQNRSVRQHTPEPSVRMMNFLWSNGHSAHLPLPKSSKTVEVSIEGMGIKQLKGLAALPVMQVSLPHLRSRIVVARRHSLQL